MGFPEQYAGEVFAKLSKRKANNTYEKFVAELERLQDESNTKNDVGCPISDDCSLDGCYRYFFCDFPEKNK